MWGGWVTSEWPINIILISKKTKQHKQFFLQHKPAQTEHKRLRLFWRRFVLGGGPTSRRYNGCILQKNMSRSLCRSFCINTILPIFKPFKSFVVVVVVVIIIIIITSIITIIIWFVTLQLFTISWQLSNFSQKNKEICCVYLIVCLFKFILISFHFIIVYFSLLH